MQAHAPADASSEEALRKAVYEDAVELERATVPQTIFERLVKAGRGNGPATLTLVEQD